MNENQESTAADNTAPSKKGGLSTKHIVLILGLVLILTSGAVAGVVLSKQQGDSANAEIAEISPTPVINEENMAEIEAEVGEKIEKGMFRTHMTTTWTFPDGSSKSSDAIMGNAAENNYPMWFEVTLDGTDEVIYTSSLLPLGSLVKEIVLNRDLEAGSYPATIRIHMMDENNEPVESNMGFAITLIIQS